MVITRGASFEFDEPITYISVVHASYSGDLHRFMVRSTLLSLKDFDTGQLERTADPSFQTHEVVYYMISANSTIRDLLRSRISLDIDYQDVKSHDNAEEDLLIHHNALVDIVRHNHEVYLERMSKD